MASPREQEPEADRGPGDRRLEDEPAARRLGQPDPDAQVHEHHGHDVHRDEERDERQEEPSDHARPCVPAGLRVPSNRIHRGEQVPAVERLRQKCHRPGIERAPTRLPVAVGGEDDDGKLVAVVDQPLLELQTVHAWHPKIQNQAFGRDHAIGSEEVLRRGEGGHLHPRRSKQRVDRLAYALVVVYDGHDPVAIHPDENAGSVTVC